MSKFCLIASLLFITLIGQAQTDKNDVIINLGVSSGYGYPSSLYRANSGIPAVNLSGDYSLNRFLSVGLYAAYTYTFYKFQYPGIPETEYKDVWKGWDVGIKSAFHFSPFLLNNEDWDLYIAAFFGYASHSLVFDRKHPGSDHISYHVGEINAGSMLGFRYYLSRNIGLYAEAGVSRKLFGGGGLSFNINTNN
ncbi:MAG TPA: hypothetical protein VH815_01960 [Acidobacteriota bacterium]